MLGADQRAGPSHDLGGDVISDVAAIGGLIGLAASVLLLAWQCWEVAKQTKIGNSIGGASVIQEAMNSDRELHSVFLERPELRAYFYDSKAQPSEGSDRDRVLTLAEMFADVLEVGLLTTRLVPSTDSNDDWTSYTRHICDHSPALVEFVRQHPEWYPNVTRVLNGRSGTPTGG
ncbi:hypothetical protein BBK14_32440 [Parafrankia soli]|uniref:DUF4760 domain-containing protein n=1 Tax=Parafrankia soli TaxID=2599596 RepID=A0A1S1R7T9_9ACTN|nr:hypothetical protein [Parafrankia soli]OHV40794.1 hypothetical protein BBK14_32440 [Parafrankia soli]